MITERKMRTNQVITSLIALVSAFICSCQTGYVFQLVLKGMLERYAAGEGLILSFLLLVGGTCGLLANIYSKKRFSFLSALLYFLGFIFCVIVGYESFPGLIIWVLISGVLSVETGYYYAAYFHIQKSK